MSTFFRQTAQAMIAKHIDRLPLLKLDQVIDWQPIEQYLNRQRTRYVRYLRCRLPDRLLPNAAGGFVRCCSGLRYAVGCVCAGSGVWLSI